MKTENKRQISAPLAKALDLIRSSVHIDIDLAVFSHLACGSSAFISPVAEFATFIDAHQSLWTDEAVRIEPDTETIV